MCVVILKRGPFYKNLHTLKIRHGSYLAPCLFHIKLCRFWWTLTVFYLSLNRSTTNASAITPRMLSLQCSRTQGQVGWKREHALWMLSKCLQSDLFSQRTLYSRMHALGLLLVWWTALPPIPPCGQGCVHFDLGVSRGRQKPLNRISSST